jgi:3-deoxy-D-manno-octulosonate 8-phosphate phosphatase (KDO 8-P phosphatase)
MTDGRIYLDHRGKELKVFNIYDGQGISLIKTNGFRVGLLSGRKSKAVEFRSKELGVSDLFQGVSNKLRCYQNLLKKYQFRDEHIAYMGDDLIDIPIMERVGFSVAVPNAVEAVKRCAHMVTHRGGGEGAVREVAEWLLKKQGKWK